jgi:hypothetical protein
MSAISPVVFKSVSLACNTAYVRLCSYDNPFSALWLTPGSVSGCSSSIRSAASAPRPRMMRVQPPLLDILEDQTKGY